MSELRMAGKGGSPVTLPSCQTCHKRLVWSPWTRRVPRKVRPRKRVTLFTRRSAQSKTAIRCLWCGLLYCPRCAQKHFKPGENRIRRVDRKVDDIVTAVVQALKDKIVRCATAEAKRWKP